MDAKTGRRHPKENNKTPRARKNYLWLDIWRRFQKRKLAVIALAVLIVIVLSAVYAESITRYSYSKQNYQELMAYPSLDHLLGTDNYGRDLFARILKGGQASLVVALLAVAISITSGVILGATASFFGGFYSSLVMRCMDMLMGIPPLLMALSVSLVLGEGLVQTAVAISISGIPSSTRIVYGSVLSEKTREYVEAATLCGSGNFKIIFRHILPNVTAPIIVNGTQKLGLSILTISSLSFIGLGVAPPTPEWGSMLNSGRSLIRTFWPIVTFPGIAISITVICFNLVGDGLRDALDPRLKN